MEIIHVILGKANPNRMNGVNKVVYQLATKQHQNKLNVSVWGITKDIYAPLSERVFKTRLFESSINPFGVNDTLLSAMLSKKGKAIFHIHGGWVPVFSKIAVFLADNNIQYVFTPHGAYNAIAMERSSVIKKIYFKLFEKKVIENASKIHCIGKSEVNGLNSIFQTTKSFLLPYGFQVVNKPVAPMLNRKEMIIGFVGRLDIYTKGLDLLVDAFEKFQRDVPIAKLWIVGDGPGRKKIKSIVAEKGLTKSVIFFGSVFGEDKDNLIRKMDIFAHPSRNEGLPSAVLEASNFGIPCVVSEATNIGDYVNLYNAGVSIQNENSEELKNAFFLFYKMWLDQSLQAMKFNAQRMVRNAFAWNNVIKDFNQLYSIKS